MQDQSTPVPSTPLPPKVRDLTGKPFGRLTVRAFAGHVRRKGTTTQATWLCVCRCGNEITVAAFHLLRRALTSCGCAGPMKRMAYRWRSHGRSFTPEHLAWRNIKARCLNPKNPRFKDYGGRGIHICDRWKDSFERFLADMGPRPSPKHSIERKDNDGPYSPDNCEWATRYKQDRNKRNSRLLTHDGRSMTVGDWAKEADISVRTLRFRLESGMPLSEAISRPIDQRYSHRKS